MSTAGLENTVRELADREAIRDLAHRYAHCVWRKDAAGVADLFADDGEADMGDRPAVRGRQALLAEYERMISGPDLQPFVHNHLIELAGDRATGVCYVDLRATMDGKAMIGSGYYEDDYVRVAEKWKFQSRRLKLAFFVPFAEGWGRT